MRAIAAVLATLITSSAHASPNISLDDPRYEELARRYVRGELRAYAGGMLPLTERRVAALLGAPASPARWWITPASLLRVTAAIFDDSVRPYSTLAKPRHLTAGSISVSCERQEGRPCGDGAAAFGEVDAAAGYGSWLGASIRLRAQAGQSDTESLVLDRAYVNAEMGPVAVEVGRDVVVLGPSARTQPAWGTNAPPITHVRMSTSEPFPLTSDVRINVNYVVGVLRAPQRFPRNLVTMARVQVDVGDALELGTVQLLQLGGEGARSLGVWDFIAEHVRRKDLSAMATDSSNRRFGADAAYRVRELGARFYYVLMFEDIRAKRWMDAVRYDADHVFGIELPALGREGQHAALFERRVTGFRSHEHTSRDTGLTHLGRVVGDPLGPDASAWFVGGRIGVGEHQLYPWIEVARLSSDKYVQVDKGPIEHTTRGPAETRYRAGVRARMSLSRQLAVEAEIIAEHVATFAFEPSATRDHAGARASLLWVPQR